MYRVRRLPLGALLPTLAAPVVHALALELLVLALGVGLDLHVVDHAGNDLTSPVGALLADSRVLQVTGSLDHGSDLQGARQRLG